MSSHSLVLIAFVLSIAGCAVARYQIVPDPTLTERIVCGTVKHGAHAQVKAFSGKELGRPSLADQRITMERHRILLDVVELRVEADTQGRYCLKLLGTDDYAFSFRAGERWATVVWSEQVGGKLDVELR
jgi:hypothetical protein